MLNRIEELIADLNKSENAAEGFSAKELYSKGQEYGLTCKEVLENFLGKDRAISRGRYPASVSTEVIIAANKAPVEVPLKKAAKKTAAKKTVNKRNKSTSVVEKHIEISKADKAARRSLIAKIAKRHAAEDEVIAALAVKTSVEDTALDDGTKEEYEKLVTP